MSKGEFIDLCGKILVQWETTRHSTRTRDGRASTKWKHGQERISPIVGDQVYISLSLSFLIPLWRVFDDDTSAHAGAWSRVLLFASFLSCRLMFFTFRCRRHKHTTLLALSTTATTVTYTPQGFKCVLSLAGGNGSTLQNSLNDWLNWLISRHYLPSDHFLCLTSCTYSNTHSYSLSLYLNLDQIPKHKHIAFLTRVHWPGHGLHSIYLASSHTHVSSDFHFLLAKMIYSIELERGHAILQ